MLTIAQWAGNPYEKFVKEGTEGYLEPRKSFKTWSETVIGKCREWTEEQVETAAVLCLVYGKFIEVCDQEVTLSALLMFLVRYGGKRKLPYKAATYLDFSLQIQLTKFELLLMPLSIISKSP